MKPFKNPKMTLQEKFAIWDAGGFVYGDEADDILKLKKGQILGDLLSEFTICPVRNGSCLSRHTLQLYGFNPNTKGKVEDVWLCPHGCINIDECLLSK